MKMFYAFLTLVLSLSLVIPSKAAPATAPLPADLLYMQAYLRYFTVTVGWGVTRDLDLVEFELLRSSDNVNYNSIARIPAVHTNEPKERYWYNDSAPLDGMNFYKLRFIMSNGEEILHDAFARVNYFELPPIIVYPNPASQKMNVSAEGATKIVLTNLDGQLVQEVPVNGNSIDVRQLPPGTYVLKVQYGDTWKSEIITVQ